MKRWTLRITICLILGVVMTVGVAWGAAFLPFRQLAQFHRLEEGATGAALSRFGGMQVWIKQVHSPEFLPSGELDLEIRVARLEILLAIVQAKSESAWNRTSQFDRVEPDQDAIDAALARVTESRRVEEFNCIDQTGWPLRAMETQFATNRVWTLTTDSRAPIQIDSTGLHPANRFLPLSPVFPDFLINTLFYAAIWFGLFFAPGMTRRFIRRRRGRCPTCGYDLQNKFDDGCPECGWNRASRGVEECS